MTDDYDVRPEVINHAIGIMDRADRLSAGSEEHSSAYNSGKALLDVCAKYEEIDFKEKELSLRQKQLEQELKIHEDNLKQTKTKNVLEGVKIGIGAGLAGLGYWFNFKHNGIELNDTFKSIKRNFVGIFK